MVIEFMNDEDTAINNKQPQKKLGIDDIKNKTLEIIHYVKLLLMTNHDEIESFVHGKQDNKKSELLQAAFDMLETYYCEKTLAIAASTPSIHMLKYTPCLKFLESHEIERLYYFYISQKKKIETSNSQIVFYPLQINNIEKSRRPESAAIAADGQNADVDYQWSPDNKIHSVSEDKKFLIDGEIVNNRLEFLLTINDENEEEVNEEEIGKLKSGTLHWGSLDIEIINGFGEINWNNKNTDENEKLCNMPLIYTPHC